MGESIQLLVVRQLFLFPLLTGAIRRTKRWFRGILHHPLLAGGFTLIISGLVEYILDWEWSWEALWPPMAIGAITTSILFFLSRLLPRDEQPYPPEEAVDAQGDEDPSRAPQSHQSIRETIHTVLPIFSLGKEFSQRTLPELALFMKDRNTEEMEGFRRHYIGKWVSVEGEVHAVTPPFLDLMTVSLHLPHPDPDASSPLKVDCRFNARKWLDALVSYSQGDRIKITGEINYIGYVSIDLGDCELEK